MEAISPKSSIASTCPLCRENNKCAVSQGGSLDECWCSNQSMSYGNFTDEQSEVVKINPLSCICQSCSVNLTEKNEC
ncbi:hypothetical protein D5R81_10245 [Parashewanella spongiae]|uniref:Cysteine-rich CWC family protein n=1 Tax=Parashewanella spongiae TaxID=342950 RepID=A0A3A6TLP7_9GAMM|nr:cysteine-rich CWC family protein [Parashewanella spongiae]MCL1078297.1 cysteine-rich CWC family protein [Parashewanella spongiae]RJY15021.1 hypothetical protein D5R81_10245 [Parashewanella spongiae]